MDDSIFENGLQQYKDKPDSDRSSGKSHGRNDAVDILSLYHGDLSKSEPLTAQEEFQCWEVIAEKDNLIRSAVYQFSFVVLEHIKIVDDLRTAKIQTSFCLPHTILIIIKSILMQMPCLDR